MIFSGKNLTITFSAFCVLLFTALLHASQNTVIRTGNDKLYPTIDINGSAAIIALICLPLAPQPSAASLPLLTVSTALQIIYTVLVVKTYQISDMSQTYPLMRGIAPLLVATISVLSLGDSLSVLAWVGIATTCLTILGMVFNRCSGSQRGIVLALINACSTAGYTLVDSTSVRLSETALGYTLWTSFLNGSCLLGWAVIARRREASHYLVQQWKKGIPGGIGIMGLYDLVLWAMTQAPLAVVTTLCEAFVLFGALLAWLLLKEEAAGIYFVVTGGTVIGAVLLCLS